MFIKNMKIKNFRNIKEAEISFCETTNIIYGDNGQGKTNLIEAIWLFSGNQSFRGSKINEYKKFDEDFLKNEISFCDSQRENKAEFVFGNKKYVKLNNVLLNSLSEMNENFFCVVFSPFLLSFVQGNPKNRRKFLDIAISQINHQYKNYLSTYEKILEQRNALLKTNTNMEFIKENIDAWDMQLAKVGTIISIYRNDYINK
ncbi:MAG: DNA replication and repair protein RecF, partial [Oscillospiraceae bacterium]